MSINYTTLFTKLGALVARSNSYGSLGTTTLPTDLQTIETAYGVTGTTYGSSQGPISGLPATYANFQNQAVSWRTGLLPFATNTLTDQDTVVSQITGLLQTDIKSVLSAIIQDMNDNSQTIKKCTSSIGSVTTGVGNSGNGTVLIDKLLDGVNAPVLGGLSHVKYTNLNSELVVPSETMTFTCTGTATEGSETWSWAGGQKFGSFDYHTEGSGAGPGLTTAHGVTTIAQNLGFQTFSANVPTGWAVDFGVAGTNILQETSNVYRGSSALKFLGDGTTATIQVSQSVSSSSLSPRQRYLVTMMITKSGPAPGAGNVVIKFTGTNYTASGSEQISVPLGSIPGTYTLYSFYITTPNPVPANLRLTIGVTGTLNNGASVFFDSGSASGVKYHGGVNAVIVSGNTPWAIGDRLYCTVTNDAAGKFQNFLRRGYQVQFPSASSPTISDGLVV